MAALTGPASASVSSRPAPGARALVFIGFMGAGKTTTAKAVAGARGLSLVDSDAVLEERLGVPVPEAFQRDGEAAFRGAEEQLVLELLANADGRSVLALGGGSVLSERVRAALAGHVTVLLDVDPQEAWRRVGNAGGTRPLARSRERFFALHAERESVYQAVADAVLPARRPERLHEALEAVAQLTHVAPGRRLLWATAHSRDYPVYFGRGLIGGELWPIARPQSRAFCVTDSTVAGLYAGQLGHVHHTMTVAPGELSKTLAGAEAVWRWLAGSAMTRDDHVAAVGGGVVGDLAGFCAATYQRGVPVVHVPTTLVAQVDSAYGGKTGVDLPGAKNYVGAYHQPAGVVVDPGTLDTLPASERAAGFAEVLKTALIAGGELWARVQAGQQPDEAMILACVRTKLSVVAQDERDGGRRQVLNLGHTLAHAIEAVTEYRRYRHGEAVALGLLAALRLSGQDELRSQVTALLEANQLPTRLDPGSSADHLLAATRRDKKRTGEQVPYVLVHAPGDVREGAVVAEDEVRGALIELGAR